ncbi:MAG: SAM-dependent methyltransferase, partial [Pseudomonadota bacterium]
MSAGRDGDALPYDPEARRDTPLALELKARIKARGPMSVRDYMHACLYDETHGYYRRADVIGTRGDFTTSPEISQLFGEIIGIWAAVVWKTIGAPERFNLIELGPGRGTLMADALRASRLVPGFLEAADVALVETNATLKAKQAETLAPHQDAVHSLSWHASPEDIWWDNAEPAQRPTILIGNEFLDTAPAAQYSWLDAGWTERWVTLDDADRIVFADPRTFDGQEKLQSQRKQEFEDRFPTPEIGDLATVPHYGMMDEIVAPWPTFVGLFIDYGHEDATIGDTLQAVRQHKFEHPLTSP